MMLICHVCGFDARTPQGLAGHMRLSHGVGAPFSRAPSSEQRALQDDRPGHREGPQVLEEEPQVRGLPLVIADADVWSRTYHKIVDRFAQRLADHLWDTYGEESFREFVEQYREEVKSPEGFYRVMNMMLPRPPQQGQDDKLPSQDA